MFPPSGLSFCMRTVELHDLGMLVCTCSLQLHLQVAKLGLPFLELRLCGLHGLLDPVELSLLGFASPSDILAGPLEFSIPGLDGSSLFLQSLIQCLELPVQHRVVLLEQRARGVLQLLGLAASVEGPRLGVGRLLARRPEPAPVRGHLTAGRLQGRARAAAERRCRHALQAVRELLQGLVPGRPWTRVIFEPRQPSFAPIAELLLSDAGVAVTDCHHLPLQGFLQLLPVLAPDGFISHGAIAPVSLQLAAQTTEDIAERLVRQRQSDSILQLLPRGERAERSHCPAAQLFRELNAGAVLHRFPGALDIQHRIVIQGRNKLSRQCHKCGASEHLTTYGLGARLADLANLRPQRFHSLLKLQAQRRIRHLLQPLELLLLYHRPDKCHAAPATEETEEVLPDIAGSLASLRVVASRGG
mmetsp:Transcript_48838/g.139794  ORF Transcript_48838/g.139794 Transcript_48838/m.139794 type:complete len:415 (+) Transcript_48838:327-1571(+)